jgi:hypothetical protein
MLDWNEEARNDPLSSDKHQNPLRYTRIRSHANDFYEAIQDKFPASPNCNCMLRHDVNMN